MDVQLDPGATPIAVASAEDVVVQKLLGFKASNRVLSRQLDDIRGVLRTQGDRFDWSYALEQAEALGVRDLAESCRAELR